MRYITFAKFKNEKYKKYDDEKVLKIISFTIIFQF